jgi:hypothetical protein
MNLNSYDHVIPIGSNCRIGMALRDLGIRKIAFPLDWTLTTSESVYKCFEDNFQNFLNHDSCIEQNLKQIVNLPHIQNKRYNVNITHESVINDTSIEKYNRKVQNLNKALYTSKSILLVRNMLDCEIADDLHKSIATIESERGTSHFDLQWIYKTKDLIQSRHTNLNVDLLVIYFDEKNIIPNKRQDVFYETSNVPKVGNEWDRYACVDILRRFL